jgi:6-pyruvoyltetrahydropterin/6-carboxytetrahydropterin synthase
MKISVSKRFTFEAAHYLPNHPGKCASPHGHSYKLEVEVSGGIDSKTGMVIDFGILDEIVQTMVIKKYDHSNMNDFFENPTAENMVHIIFLEINNGIFFKGLSCVLTKITLWETEKCKVIWRREQ